ncbi:hypothetical protein BDV59DRAFT_211169 [Aspergillus ambiguus]|uniref:uncharacterized protein n=1 Tax=Aspergillus ambiguus TaxID=176160 RepID=UPI003CCDE1C6
MASLNDEGHPLQRVLDYINSTSFVSLPDAIPTPPISCPSLSEISGMESSIHLVTPTRSKNISYAAGAAYKLALQGRGVRIQLKACLYDAPSFLNELNDTVSVPHELESSLCHAMSIRDTALNEITYYLVFPFFITEWLSTASALKFAVSIQWSTDHLQSSQTGTQALTMPKPDFMIGFSWAVLFRDYFPPLDLNYLFPISGNSDTCLAFFALEAKLDGAEIARLQNLHTAALMLKALRRFFEACYGSTQEFDHEVRVLTVTLTRHEACVYGHWTRVDPNTSISTYEHFQMASWAFYDKKEDLCRVRRGLEAFCNWIVVKNTAWIIPGIQKMCGPA